MLEDRPDYSTWRVAQAVSWMLIILTTLSLMLEASQAAIAALAIIFGLLQLACLSGLRPKS